MASSGGEGDTGVGDVGDEALEREGWLVPDRRGAKSSRDADAVLRNGIGKGITGLDSLG